MHHAPDHRPARSLQHCVGILLAAGFGTRFMAADHTPASPGKLLARLPDGRSVAQTAAQSLLGVAHDTLPVTRPDTPALNALLRETCAVVLETQDARRGMGASLAAAARHLMAHCDPDLRAALIALADMPWIEANTYSLIARAAAEHAVVVPTWNGRRGHPVAVQRHLWPELAALDGDVGARTLLQRHPVHEVATADPGILRDVDVPEDLPHLL